MPDEPGFSRALDAPDQDPDFRLSRRALLVALAGTSAALAVFGPAGLARALSERIIVDNCLGLVLAEPSRCVGCGRCELACAEFNLGLASPKLSRIKIARNLAYGPAGPTSAQPFQGNFGNGRIIADVCRQCPHPVPCATACPHEAIVAGPATNARVIDSARCTGCRLCLGACPYAMMVFDETTGKASKCDLCQGKPKCQAACPAGALTYVAWRDLTRENPPRVPFLSALDPQRAAACRDCHK